MRAGDKMRKMLSGGASEVINRLIPPIKKTEQLLHSSPRGSFTYFGRDRALMSARCGEALVKSSGNAPRLPAQRYAALVEQTRRARYEQETLADYFANVTTALLSDTGPLALLDRMLKCAGEGDATQWRLYRDAFADRVNRLPAAPPYDAEDEHAPSYQSADTDDVERLIALLEDHSRRSPPRDLYGNMIIGLREIAAGGNSDDLLRWSSEARTRLRDVLIRMPAAARRELAAQYRMLEA